MCGGQSNQCLISGSKQDNLILTNFLLIVCVLIANWRRNEIRVDWACGSARSAIAWGFLYKQQFDAEIIQINGNGKYFHDSSEPQNGCSPVSLCILEPRRHHTLIHRGRQSFWTYFLFKTNTTCEWRSAFQATLSYYNKLHHAHWGRCMQQSNGCAWLKMIFGIHIWMGSTRLILRVDLTEHDITK